MLRAGKVVGNPDVDERAFRCEPEELALRGKWRQNIVLERAGDALDPVEDSPPDQIDTGIDREFAFRLGKKSRHPVFPGFDAAVSPPADAASEGEMHRPVVTLEGRDERQPVEAEEGIAVGQEKHWIEGGCRIGESAGRSQRRLFDNHVDRQPADDPAGIVPDDFTGAVSGEQQQPLESEPGGLVYQIVEEGAATDLEKGCGHVPRERAEARPEPADQTDDLPDGHGVSQAARTTVRSVRASRASPQSASFVTREVSFFA